MKLDQDPNQPNDADTQKIIILISNTDRVRRYKSNFYSALLVESKVEKVSTALLDENYREILPELSVPRGDFKKFVIDQIVIAPVIYKGVNVEIVSPVLQSGKLKWKGVYDSEVINFNLHDAEFRQSVINRKVSFINGTVIKCDVEFERQIDQNGEIKITSVNVSNIVEITQSGLIVETPKGKRQREMKSQLGIFE